MLSIIMVEVYTGYQRIGVSQGVMYLICGSTCILAITGGKSQQFVFWLELTSSIKLVYQLEMTRYMDRMVPIRKQGTIIVILTMT
jgi:hypothetical protein